ncbi:hypothetical protein Pla108_00340 [Botrimarina colliarenosi]|uniref:Uncharacterized protein n=1 Tax=Botrimarina colliarenosi TaxID=2528001 RepID=A0A5C6AJ59_9BACT|nr:hypothetical protein Pla108_00340 [Botrimarina colliarenosi]
MGEDPELWKKLELGDRVRISRFPSYEGCLHDDTAALYRWLVETSRVLTVMKLEFIEEQAYPWSGEIVWSMDSSHPEEFHWLMLNHDGLERVD